MTKTITPEIIEQKLNRPRPKKFRLPPTDLGSPPIKSILQAVLAIARSPRVFLGRLIKAALPDESALVTDKKYRNRLSASLAEYTHWYYLDKKFLHSITWMGVPSRKMISDLWVYQEIVYQTKPDYIIEIGSFFGGSTLFLANICDMMGQGSVISIDVSRHVYQVSHPRVTELTGDCSDVQVIEKVKEIVGTGSVMVIHDGDHTRAAVMRDLDIYGPLVTAGQYLIIEDGVVDLFNPAHSRMARSYPEGGPLPAARDFLKRNSHIFELDMTRERFILTSNPEGYLRRKASAEPIDS